ncbi:MAG: NYN domain-containing protein [Chromatiales bacterium]|nr:NYN domain-containing protein [Chromatiales bacterium]
MTETSVERVLWPADPVNTEIESSTDLENEGLPTETILAASESVPPGEIAGRPEEGALVVPLQPPRSVALYIDGDNQSPAITRDLLASIRHDWGLDVSCVVLAGNDHGYSVPRWLTALGNEGLPEGRILALRVPRKPEAADLALILELGANMEQHRQWSDLVVIVSRDEWLIRAAEAVRARGCRVWVAYAENEAVPAQTHLPTLLLPAINRAQALARAAHFSPKTPVEHEKSTASKFSVMSTIPEPMAEPQEAAPADQSTSSHKKLLAQVRAQCQLQPDGGYLASEVGQVLYKLGLTDKAARTRFLKAIDGLQEAGASGAKRLVF